MAIALAGLRRCHRHFYGRLRRSAYRKPRVSQQQLLSRPRPRRDLRGAGGLAVQESVAGCGYGQGAGVRQPSP